MKNSHNGIDDLKILEKMTEKGKITSRPCILLLATHWPSFRAIFSVMSISLSEINGEKIKQNGQRRDGNIVIWNKIAFCTIRHGPHSSNWGSRSWKKLKCFSLENGPFQLVSLLSFSRNLTMLKSFRYFIVARVLCFRWKMKRNGMPTEKNI